MATAVEDQEAIFKDLLKTGARTAFGVEHQLDKVSGHAEYRQAIPIRDYEQYKPYIEQVKEGKHNVLWKGKPNGRYGFDEIATTPEHENRTMQPK